MRLVTAELRTALQATAPAINTAPSSPVLAGVRLHSTGDGFTTLSTTDLDTWCTYRCTVDGADTLDVLVSHRTLANIAKVVRAATVTVAVDGSKLLVTAGKSSWSAPIIADTLPNGPSMPARAGTIDADALRQLVKFAAPAATRAKDQPLCEVLQFRSEGDALVVSATDRYRAHLVGSPFNADVDTVTAFPPAADVARVVETLTGEVELFTDTESGVFGFADGTATVLLRMFSLEPPGPPDMADYLAKLPEPAARTVVDAGQLAEALDTIAPATGGVGTPALLTITPESFTVAGRTDDAAAETVVEDFTHDGAGLVVAVQPVFLADALKALGAAQVTFAWIHPAKPVTLTADGVDATVILMPIRAPESRWLDRELVAAGD